MLARYTEKPAAERGEGIEPAICRLEAYHSATELPPRGIA